MKKDIIKIYCDESGYTGNNLLDKNQEVFTYATVKTSEEEAEEIIKKFAKKFNINSDNEIKCSNLLTMKKDDGRYFIDEILKYYSDNFKVSISNKKYALAGKFFEYTFEPPLSECNSIIYRLSLHRMISMYLYVCFVSKNESVEEIFNDFYNFISGKTETLFSQYQINANTPMHGIIEFISKNQKIILDEINSLKGAGANKFILDLSYTSLFGLLAYWGEKYDSFTVFCDASKPIASQTDIFDRMVKKQEKIYSHFGIEEVPITFSLNEPLHIVDSKLNFGVQVADFISGAMAYSFNNKEDNDFKKRWRGLLNESNAPLVLLPEKEYLDGKKHSVQLNTILFREILRRSRENESLSENLSDFVNWASNRLKIEPLT